MSERLTEDVLAKLDEAARILEESTRDDEIDGPELIRIRNAFASNVRPEFVRALVREVQAWRSQAAKVNAEACARGPRFTVTKEQK